MFNKLSRIAFFFLFLAFGAVCVNAQLPDPTGIRDPRSGKPEELPKSLKESMHKSRIEEEKKEYEERIKRGEEVARLSEELSKSFEQNSALSAEDQKKLARLEKLIKKIRDDLGGEDDNEADANNNSRPSSLTNALKSVQENASSLLTALKKTSRLTISAVAIETSNTVLKLVRFIRFYKN